MKRSVALLAVVGVAILSVACSPGISSPAGIATAKRNVDHWQTVVNEDQAQVSQDEGCPLTSGAADCTPQVNNPEAVQAQAKLRADEARLFTAENELTKAEGQ
jgi:hypothetical protein